MSEITDPRRGHLLQGPGNGGAIILMERRRSVCTRAIRIAPVQQHMLLLRRDGCSGDDLREDK